jgi:hypothetical protein
MLEDRAKALGVQAEAADARRRCQEIAVMILRYSSSVNARDVTVRTFPVAALESASFATISSLLGVGAGRPAHGAGRA